jgi:hypothetical protein
MTHGLLAKSVVITEGDGKENPAEFRRVHEALRDNLKPYGMLEEMLVERIACCYWRLRRALRAERGEIGRVQGTVTWRYAIEQGRKQLQFQRLPHVFRDELKMTGSGLQILLHVLDEVKREVDEHGMLTDEATKLLIDHFGSEENGLWYWCFFISHLAKRRCRGDDDPELPSPEKCKTVILSLLEEERERLVTIKDGIDEKEHLELASMATGLSLPDTPATDKILRYETTIERQMYRAIDQLERLQRQRLGDDVPAPTVIALDGPP